MPDIGYVALGLALFLIGYCFLGSFQKCNRCGGWNAHAGICDDCLQQQVAAKAAQNEDDGLALMADTPRLRRTPLARKIARARLQLEQRIALWQLREKQATAKKAHR